MSCRVGLGGLKWDAWDDTGSHLVLRTVFEQEVGYKMGNWEQGSCGIGGGVQGE